MDNEKIIWHTEKRKLSELIPFSENPRSANEKEWQDLDISLSRFNLAEPLIVNQNNHIIGGHFRTNILKQKKIEKVDVRAPNRLLTLDEEKELNLRLNKNVASWDYDMLANFDEELLKNVGFESGELDEVFRLETDDEFDVEKELQEFLQGEARRVSDGDIWQLGDHRLIIGDAVKKENWERVLAGERFDFLFTDPPYKLAYTQRKRKIKTKEGFKLKEKGFGFRGNRFYKGVEKRGGVPEYDEWLSLANEYQNPQGANVMIFENWRNTRELWDAIEKYWKIHNMIIWHLPNRHQGFSRPQSFFNKYDIIIYGQTGESSWDRKKKSKWTQTSDHISWRADSETSSKQNIIFGTKPIQILTPYVKILSPREGIIVDCFAGSGSTLIACEIMKRKCRAIEIEPIYGEVILRRWERLIGQKATKLN